MSVIYKSLKEIRALKSGPAKGGGLGPRKRPGGSKTLIILVCVLVVATLALGGVWFYLESMEQAGPDLAARPPRTRPSVQTPPQASNARPASVQPGTQQDVHPGKRAEVPANNSATPESPAASVTKGQTPPTGNKTGTKTGNATGNETGKTTVKSKAVKNASKEPRTFDVNIPAEPAVKKPDAEDDSLRFISKVRRNQMVMEFQTKLDQARRRHDPEGVRHYLDKIEKLLGPDSFLVLQWQGNLAVLDKDYALAEQRYRRALTLNPRDVHCRMNLVLSLIGAKKFPMAERELTRIEQEYPNDPRIRDLRLLLAQSQRYKPMKPLVNDLHNASQQSSFGTDAENETAETSENVIKPSE